MKTEPYPEDIPGRETLDHERGIRRGEQDFADGGVNVCHDSRAVPAAWSDAFANGYRCGWMLMLWRYGDRKP